jgi:hypothetical protein
MCPPNSPFRQIPSIRSDQDMAIMYPHRADVPHDSKSFIFDNQKSTDWCENPLLTQLVRDHFGTAVDRFHRTASLFKTFGDAVNQCPPLSVKVDCTTLQS